MPPPESSSTPWAPSIFPKDEDDDIRAKFEYAKRAGVNVIVAGDPAPATLPRIEKFVREYDIRLAIHNHGPEDKIYPLAVRRAEDRQGYGPAHRLLHRRRATRRARGQISSKPFTPQGRASTTCT